MVGRPSGALSETEKLARRRAYWDRVASGFEGKHIPDKSTRVDVPADAIAERDRAYGGEPNANQLVLGDPRPGRSYLDRVQQEAARQMVDLFFARCRK